MEKVILKSRVYNNHRIVLNGGPVQFVNGRAEVSEELYQEIVSRKLPDIYKEGEEPEFKTRLEEKLRSEVKEGNKEYEEEIKRLKNIVEAQKVEISKKEKEIEVWKKCVEDLKAGNKYIINMIYPFRMNDDRPHFGVRGLVWIEEEMEHEDYCNKRLQ